jgi:hypothetical protein
VIGGGSGLSSAAGYDHYHWSPALSEALAPFREQYGFTSPLAGFYHCFSSYGEQWGYYSQYIRFLWEAPTGQPYLDLRDFYLDIQKTAEQRMQEITLKDVLEQYHMKLEGTLLQCL